MNIVGQLEEQQTKKEPPALRPGETVRVHVKVVEGEKERTQIFEGIVIAMSGSGNRAMFTVRKISYGVGVERIFPLGSPSVEKIEIKSRGHVRRSRLYYLRELKGKKARLRSKIRDLSLLIPEEGVAGTAAEALAVEAPPTEEATAKE